jgi:hypothetical protein
MDMQLRGRSPKQSPLAGQSRAPRDRLSVGMTDKMPVSPKMRLLRRFTSRNDNTGPHATPEAWPGSYISTTSVRTAELRKKSTGKLRSRNYLPSKLIKVSMAARGHVPGHDYAATVASQDPSDS